MANDDCEATRPKAPNPTDIKRSGSTMRQTTSTTKAHTRGNSYASSTMSRPGATSTRSAAGGFSSTVGAGSTRPASAMSRPASTIGTRKLNGSSISRPATSMDTRMDDAAGSILGKRKGMQYSHLSHNIPPVPTGSLHGLDPRSNNIPPLSLDDGIMKLSSKLSHISLTDSHVPSGVLCPLSPQFQVDYTPCAPRRFGASARAVITRDPLPQQTSFVPISHSPKRKPIPLFLTKNSTVRSFNNPLDTQWDRESREKEMDDMFVHFMSRMNQQGQSSAGLKESVDFYKTRSKSI